MTSRIFMLAAAALTFAGLGLAARADTIGAQAFLKKVNTNGDKTISLEELDAYAKTRFAELEADKDKTLDQKELKGRLSEAGMTMADTDKDESVDEKEFVGYADKLFAEANKTGDKTLSVEELESDAGTKLRMLLQ